MDKNAKRNTNFDRLDLFQPGSPLTSLSAGEMNKRIVRPLNTLLRTTVKHPLRLFEVDGGLVLVDLTAVAASAAGNVRNNFPRACMIPLLNDLIDAQVDGTNGGFDVIDPDITKTYECSYVLEVDWECEIPRWKPAGSNWKAFIRDDGEPGNLTVVAEATNEGMTGVTMVVTGTEQINVSAETVDDIFMSIQNHDYPSGIGYFKITDARYISSAHI